MAKIIKTMNKKLNTKEVVRDAVIAIILAYFTYEHFKSAGYIACGG